MANPNSVQTTPNVTGTVGFPNAIANYYDKRLLDFLKKMLHLDEFGEMKKLPKNSGNAIVFTRYTPFQADTTALVEGVPPEGQVLASTQITAIPVQYGDVIQLSDYLIAEAIDPVIEGALEILGYQAALSLDTIIRNTLHSNLTVQWAGGAANANATTAVMTAAEIRKAVAGLKRHSVRPIGDSYPCLISTDQAYDLQSETNTGAWLDITKYTTTGPLYKGEIGKLYGSRIVETQNANVIANATPADIHYAFMFGKGCYGLVELAGNNLKTIVKQLGSAGTADPIDQISTVGYKFSHITKVLDSTRGIEIGTATAAYSTSPYPINS